MRKRLYRFTIYTILTIASPFIWMHRKYNKRKSDVKYSSIVEGFANAAFPSEVIEETAKKRAAICAQCPFAMYSATMSKVIVDNKTKEIRGMYCDVCGCNLTAKIRSRDFCPRGKW